jgi:hypothetical protein
MTDRTVLDRLRADRALTVVRAERIPDLLGPLGKAAAAGLPTGVGSMPTGCAGTSVVPPAAVEAGAWSEITERARAFAAARTARRER